MRYRCDQAKAFGSNSPGESIQRIEKRGFTMAFSNERLAPVEADDFQRVGLRRMEFRPQVIRRALIRSAQPLALMHLRSPSAEVERLLLGVMLSGYRVLDPRRRDDSNQRVMLGRIHPQLVEEAVYLAQQRSAPGDGGSGVVGAVGAGAPVGKAVGAKTERGAGGAGSGNELPTDASGGEAVIGLVGEELPNRMTAEFSPISHADWLEAAESALGLLDRGSPGLGELPMSTSNRFLEVSDASGWDTRLSGSDLMVQPTHLRIFRAIRRRLARASAASLLAAVMLAASILLVVTWRTTAWVRSLGGQPISVEVVEPVLSAAELARLSAPEQSLAPQTTDKRPESMVARASGEPSEANTMGTPTAGGSPAVASTAEASPRVGGTTSASAAANVPAIDNAIGREVEAAMANMDPVRASDRRTTEVDASAAVAIAPAASPASSTTPVAPPALPVDGVVAKGESPAMTRAGAVDESEVKGAVPGDAGSIPVAAEERVASRASVAGPDTMAAGKSGDQERGELELLGLVEPAGTIGGMVPESLKPLPALPEDNLLASARLRVESAARASRAVSGAAPSVGAAAVSSNVQAFRRIANESAAGSPERYVAVLLAGQTGAVVGLTGEANRTIDDLSRMFDIDRPSAMVRLARWMAADVVSGEDLRAVGKWLDGQIRASMLAGELPVAGELVAVLQEVGLKHRDEGLRGDAKLWRDVLVIGQRYADGAARVEAAGEGGQVTADDRGLAGRYWAQVRRDWLKALPYLAACSTPKFTKLAGIELLGGQTIDREDAEILADGYLAEAKRAKGWLGDSFALHSHDLLMMAAANAPPAEGLELNRRAIAIRGDYPQAFIAADDRVAAVDKQDRIEDAGGEKPAVDGDGATDTTRPAASEVKPDGASSMVLPDRGPPQMLGRLRVDGQDALVLLRYQAGKPLNRRSVDQVTAGLRSLGDRPFDFGAGKNLELHFAGMLTVSRAKTLTFHLAGNVLGGRQTLSINGQPIPIQHAAGGRLPKRIEVDLMPGDYLVRWTTPFSDGDDLSLRVVDESTGNLVPIYAPPTSIADHPGSLPTRLRINLFDGE